MKKNIYIHLSATKQYNNLLDGRLGFFLGMVREKKKKKAESLPHFLKHTDN